MKRKQRSPLLIFLTVACICYIPNFVFAQEAAPVVEIISITENAGITEICIQSDHPFIIGANRYVLYIGKDYYLRNVHPGGNENKITFFITTTQFQSHSADDDVLLVYGMYDIVTNEENTVIRTDAPYYNLGKLKK